MTRVLLAIAAVIVCFASCAYADSVQIINIRQVNILIVPNDGTGGNVGFSFTNLGILIDGDGGMNCFDWCGTTAILPPGSSMNPSSDLFFDFLLHVIIGGKSFDNESSFIFESSINAAGSIFFPTDGRGFTVTLPASLGSPLMLGLPNGKTVLVNIPKGKLTLTFGFRPAQGDEPATYFFTRGNYIAMTTVPEPSSLLLLGTGCLGLLGTRRIRACVAGLTGWSVLSRREGQGP